MHPILLATDLDGTLVGDDSALSLLNKKLLTLRQNNQLRLVYVTGRSPELYRQLADEKKLLEPDALLTAVGTELYLNGVRWRQWPNVIKWDTSYIRSQLDAFTELALQPKTEQRDFKVSYYLEDGYGLIPKIIEKLGSDYNVIYSGNCYLDILPLGVDKGSAIAYYADYLGIARTSIITCGDSANDIAMLKEYRAIVVANAQPDLLTWLTSDTVAEVYKAKAPFAAGILEGLRHFDVIT